MGAPQGVLEDFNPSRALFHLRVAGPEGTEPLERALNPERAFLTRQSVARVELLPAPAREPGRPAGEVDPRNPVA